jgi:hypothetical protein
MSEPWCPGFSHQKSKKKVVLLQVVFFNVLNHFKPHSPHRLNMTQWIRAIEKNRKVAIPGLLIMCPAGGHSVMMLEI